MKKIAAIALIVLALIMLYLSYKTGGLPPAVTGIGFIIIAMVFIRESQVGHS
ncbi:MAG TPA: hypothetical protein PKN99_12780 [Cyclobacteriaceae bacterium]|jgi:hypothetical protein|nr:hypothetical protein [Cyclobacteriaceae bacterium]